MVFHTHNVAKALPPYGNEYIRQVIIFGSNDSRSFRMRYAEPVCKALDESFPRLQRIRLQLYATDGHLETPGDLNVMAVLNNDFTIDDWHEIYYRGYDCLTRVIVNEFRIAAEARDMIWEVGLFEYEDTCSMDNEGPRARARSLNAPED